MSDNPFFKVGGMLSGEQQKVVRLRTALQQIFTLCQHTDFGADEQTEINNICIDMLEDEKVNLIQLLDNRLNTVIDNFQQWSVEDVKSELADIRHQIWTLKPETPKEER